MFQMRNTPNRLRTGPALLGADNRDIYVDLLGYTETEYRALQDDGSVGTEFPASIWSPG